MVENLPFFRRFLLLDAMRSADYAITWCLSTRRMLSKWLYISFLRLF